MKCIVVLTKNVGSFKNNYQSNENFLWRNKNLDSVSCLKIKTWKKVWIFLFGSFTVKKIIVRSRPEIWATDKLQHTKQD